MKRTLGPVGTRRVRASSILTSRILGMCVGLSAAASAQTSAPTPAPRGTIAGEVVDAETLRPLSAATVVLRPGPDGVLPPAPGAGSSFLSLGRSVVTGEQGAYRFADLAFGDYQLRVQRVGFRPVTVDVQLRASDDARVSVGLTVAPIRLQPLTVRAHPRPPYGRMEAATDEETASRVGAARLRQQLYLATDVREVTHPDVSEAVTLGTTDLFRALHRLPGVTTRDEDAAELWTRGSRPDQTRVYFDGQPLFGPLHAFGAFTGISTLAIGAAFLHPGVRPASIGEGGAAVLDVHSRPGGSPGDVRGVAELGTAAGLTSTGARLALDRRARDGRSAWMIAGGRSIFDFWPTGALGTYWYAGPGYFADLAGRFDIDLGVGRRLELSALTMHDRRQDDSSGYNTPRLFAWGNDVGRATLSWPLSGLRSRHTIGVSRFRARVDTMGHDFFDPQHVAILINARELPMRSGVLYASLSGDFEPEPPAGERVPWAVGYELAARQVSFDGDMRHVLIRVESIRHARAWETPTASLWGTRRWRVGERLTVEPGLRLDAGPALANAGVIRALPRVQARFALDSQTALSAGTGRSLQYAQAVGRMENGLQAVMYPTPLWLGADGATPALRTDIATAGIERWLAGTWLVGANVYHRRSGGYLLPDPRPGPLVDRGALVAGSERASGLEVAARKLSGPLTGSASYSYGVARTSGGGFSFASGQDRRHSVDVALLARLRPSLQFSAAFTHATGAPFTRLRAARAPQDDSYISASLPDSLYAGLPNDARKPTFSSLDVALDWSFKVFGVRAATYIQFRNALMHPNPGVYLGSRFCSDCGEAFLSNRSSNVLLPVIGLRARF